MWNDIHSRFNNSMKLGSHDSECEQTITNSCTRTLTAVGSGVKGIWRRDSRVDQTLRKFRQLRATAATSANFAITSSPMRKYSATPRVR